VCREGVGFPKGRQRPQLPPTTQPHSHTQGPDTNTICWRYCLSAWVRSWSSSVSFRAARYLSEIGERGGGDTHKGQGYGEESKYNQHDM
jgi:hypothetical protein